MEPARKEIEGAQARLGLWDATSIIVGIIIGVGIFETPQEVFAKVPGAWHGMGVWCLGGILAMVGAFCFAELASTYPHSGGEYVYLTRAYGSLVGFLFAWAQLAVIRPAGIGALAFVFADLARQLWDVHPLIMAMGAVALLSLINIMGVTLGAHTQNLLTVAKVLGLAAIVVVGLIFSEPQPIRAQAAAVESNWFAGVMITVLWSFGGWHEAAYVAAEVKDNRRNLPLSLIMGTLAVTFIYLLVNGALLFALGFEGARTHKPVDVIQSGVGLRTVSVLIMVSALGALNGMIFTTARIFSAFGNDHRLYTPLSRWSRRLGTPLRALVVQGLIGMVYLLVGGLLASGLDSLNYWIKLTAAVFWFFFLLTGFSLFVLRAKDPDLVRPFRVPCYPILPLIFCGSCAYMIYGAVEDAPRLSLFGLLVVFAGLPLYYLPQKRKYVRIVQEVEPPLVGAGHGK